MASLENPNGAITEGPSLHTKVYTLLFAPRLTLAWPLLLAMLATHLLN